MPGLCPNCGKYLCDHTPEERGQTQEQFEEDMRREFTPEEIAAWESADPQKKLAAARRIADQRKQGTFKPTFPK
jgi:hypothetical protein